MRITRISGRNLASLAGDFEVNLATGPLAHAGVFAIAGPTGAGKSTLLDAICLALFNQTPRLGAKSSFDVPDVGEERIGAIDVRHLLRRGRAEGFAEVEFEGRDQRRWVARWEVRRARAKRGADGRLQDVELSLREVGAPTAVAGGKKEVLEAIKAALGLDFDQFRRSVLLAQGDFAAFLRARSDERSALLENMTGTSIYSRISAEVFRRAREAAAVTERLRERLSATRALEPEVRAGLHARLDEIITARAAASERESAFNRILGWWRDQQKLVEALTAADARVAQAQAARDLAAPRRAALAELKRLAPLRTPRDALRAAADALARATEGARIRADQARQAAEAVTAMTELVVQARAAERDANERAEALRPVLRDAAALDGEIAGRQAAAAAASQAQVDTKQRLDALQRQTKRLTDARDVAIAQRDRAQRQLDEHPALVALIPSWTHSRSVLDRALGEAAAASKGDADARRLAEAVDAAHRARADQAGLVEAANARWIAAEARARQAQAALVELPEAPLLRRADALDAVADDLRRRASTHERWSNAEAARSRHQDEAAHADRDAEAYDREAAEITAGLQELALDLQAAERLADRLALAPLRERLVDGEPCPLCGATHHPGHPDADEAPPDDLCARLRRQQQQDTGRRDAALARADAARERAVRAREAAANAAAPLAALVAEWSARPHLPLAEPAAGDAAANGAPAADAASTADGAPGDASMAPAPPIDAPAPPIDDSATAGWIAARARAIEAARAALAAKRDARTRAMDASDAAQIAERDARAAVTEADRALRAKESAVVDAERAAQRASDLANGARERLEVGVSALGPVLTALPDAEPRLRRADRALVVELDAKIRELRTVQGELQAQADAAQRAMNELTAAEGGLPELTDAVRRADEASVAAAASAREAVERRQGLLDGRPVAEVERELQREVRAAAHNRETAERNLGQTEQRASTLQGQAEAAAQGAQQAVVDHQAASDLLDASLREYGVSIEALERALSTAPAWAEAEARALAAIDDDVARATGAREASRAALDAHGLPPEVDATNAQEALAEASATVQALDTERGALDQQLRDDDALRAAATGIEADLHRAMEHEDRAARLNVLIGSADGKRFRTFAQSLTLEALLLAANEHLSTLAPRYRLRRAEVAREPLELLVVDRDLADELRPVASLSGGETFLVSLALALGLSSLASDRLRIDSLFIDEGFGTLDPETLEIALSTLDALQSEGRQVGIISHVQGIGERIGARVLVERVGGGASRVRVVVG